MNCPYCGEKIQELEWQATIVRSNISDDGIIGGKPFDDIITVPPGTWTVRPCGHRIDPGHATEIARRMAERT